MSIDVDERVSHPHQRLNMTAADVVFAILGNKVTIDTNDLEGPNAPPYVLSGSWRFDGGSCFTGFDNPRQGMIGLRKLNSIAPEDIAEAAHESFHAVLHMQGIDEDQHDEQKINKFAAIWLKKHLSGPELIAALMHLDHSNSTYFDEVQSHHPHRHL